MSIKRLKNEQKLKKIKKMRIKVEYSIISKSLNLLKNSRENKKVNLKNCSNR